MTEPSSPAGTSASLERHLAEILHCEQDQPELGKLCLLHATMVTHGHRRDDPVRRLMSYLGDRWSVLILLVLDIGTLRYRQLYKVINTLIPADEKLLSQRMLTLRLGDLEAEGLILREASNDIPPQVHYRLSAFGSEYIARIRDFIAWVTLHSEQGKALPPQDFHARRERPKTPWF